jgi:dTDP-4-dehydrorhamnose reductase
VRRPEDRAAHLILIVGGDSQIGAALSKSLANRGLPQTSTTRQSRHGAGRHYLDLAADPSEWNLPDDVDVAVICAGVTKADDCFRHPEQTRRINVEAISALAESIARQGGHLVFLSSNQVFDGLTPLPGPLDPVSPITEYGRQKVEAEARLLEACGSSGVSVLRLTKVLGAINPLFDGWVKSLRSGGVVRAFSDMSLAPVPMSTVVAALIRLIDEKPGGIFHLSSRTDVTYETAARLGAAAVGASNTQVDPIRARDAIGDRPYCPRSALDAGSSLTFLGLDVPDAAWTLTQAFIDPSRLQDPHDV